jgi:hypothetical protein
MEWLDNDDTEIQDDGLIGGDPDDDFDDDLDDDLDDEVDEDDDNIGDVSVEINVEELVADIETAKGSGDASKAARRRLEALLEEKRLKRLLDEDDDFGFDDLDLD